jgi:hypothetical protein
VLSWGFALVSMAMLLSHAFGRTRTASIVAYLLIIFSVNFGLLWLLLTNRLSHVVFVCLVLLGVYFNLNVYKDETPIAPYWMYPPFVFYRGIYLLTSACSSFHCLQVCFSVSPSRGVVTLIAFALPLSHLVPCVLTVTHSWTRCYQAMERCLR